MSHIIRLAKASDSESVLNIYAPYVRNTAISFETEIPDINEFSGRIEAICKQYPFLVYQADDQIVGYIVN